VSPDWPIETSRLTLRPFVDDDFEAFHAMRSDEEVARYLYQGPLSQDESRDLLSRKIAGSSWANEGDWLSVAAVERESGLTVGDAVLCWGQRARPDRGDRVHLRSAPSGQGFATEAARALLDWSFGTAGLHRVIGRLEARNTASARVLEKLGMRLEAHLVENEWVKEEWQSELDYAILDREWTNRSGE
jgi:RimJ/RimL family protein N-acetyltransferase